MKLFSNIQARTQRTNISAFTLVEMMVSVVVFLFIFIGVMVAIQVFGLRIYTLAATKLSATAGARQAVRIARKPRGITSPSSGTTRMLAEMPVSEMRWK